MKILWSNEVWGWYRKNNLEEYVNSKGQHTDEPVLPEFLNSARLEFNTKGNEEHQDIIVENFLGGMTEWDECLVVITLLGVWPSAEDWPRFYNWRSSNGSRFSVSDAPGHLFYSTDILELKLLLTQIFEFGWEGYMLFKSCQSKVDTIVFISHDGWLKVNSNLSFTLHK
jgi:hypothetical protein